ncbi:MAG TPA: hypothetical protein VG796_21305 [Verrucomicrobiales bacterium]|nr:hypothetical protein [Verrucomicrobiales bacterium]
MIFVNYPNHHRPPKEWLETANKITAEMTAAYRAACEKIGEAKASNCSSESGVGAADLTECYSIIEKHKGFWGELRGWLEEFSLHKCWFSEAKNAASYWHVEHFRPKKSAKEPTRQGYWWLAFDFKNYRLCGSAVNSPKGAYFPLKEGTSASIGPLHNCDDEWNVLIDPTRKADVDLITFSEGGIAVPNSADPWGQHRAQVSIERYNLNTHSAFVRARANLWERCETFCNDLITRISERKEAESKGIFSKSTEIDIENLKQKIRQLTLPGEEFSGVARAYLLQHPSAEVRSQLG